MSCNHTPPNDDPYNPFNSSCEECSRLENEIQSLKVRLQNVEDNLISAVNSIRELTNVLIDFHTKEKNNG